MPVPKYYEFFPHVMECLLPGEAVNASKVGDFVAKRMQLSEGDRQTLLPSGTQTVFNNRLNWAMTYLRKAGLMVSLRRGLYQITDRGREAYRKTGGKIDLAFLGGIESFLEFSKAGKAGGETDNQPGSWKAVGAQAGFMEESTPQDMLDAAYEKIKSSLADDLLAEVMGKSPAFFERLVVNLLVRMGYGGTVDNAGLATGRSGDEGIDGVIREDKLGFSHIYIQAKRWDPDTTIGRPEIQRFFGALAGQRGSKGLFVTTARFSREAREYAVAQHIVLVDGRRLAELMIDHNVGVSPRNVYEIKRIDTDYFNEEE